MKSENINIAFNMFENARRMLELYAVDFELTKFVELADFIDQKHTEGTKIIFPNKLVIAQTFDMEDCIFFIDYERVVETNKGPGSYYNGVESIRNFKYFIINNQGKIKKIVIENEIANQQSIEIIKNMLLKKIDYFQYAENKSSFKKFVNKLTAGKISSYSANWTKTLKKIGFKDISNYMSTNSQTSQNI